jgi:hypothetical protein
MRVGLVAGTLAVVLLGSVGTVSAQKKPLASPRDSLQVTVAGAQISVNYGRPSKRGRMVFDSLVPFGKVWRTGANAATTFTTSKGLMIGSLMVPAGTYTLFTIPGKSSWQLIVNKQTGQWGLDYDAAKDLGRVEMKVEALPSSVETMVIKVEPSGKGGVLRVEWDRTAAVAAFVVH